MKKFIYLWAFLLIAFGVNAQSQCQAFFGYYIDEAGLASFVDSSYADSSAIIMQTWDLGDGTSATGEYITHQYETGSYVVCLTVTTSAGCTSTYCDSIYVGQTNICDMFIDYTVSETINPNGVAAYTIDVTVFGGTPPYQYYWDNGQYTEDLYDVPSGVYTVNVYDNMQCYTSATIITGDSVYYDMYVYVETNGLSSTGACDGYAVAWASGGTEPYSYIWSTGDTASSIYDLCEGYYEVTVIDANHDTAVGGTFVEHYSDCYSYFEYYNMTDSSNAAFTYSFNDYSWSSDSIVSWYWEFGDGSTSTLQNPTHTYSTDGEYTVCLSIFSMDSCSNMNCMYLNTSDTVYPPDTSLYVYVSAYDATMGLCDGSVYADIWGGTYPYQIQWSNGQTESYLENVCPGYYTVIVTDASGQSVTATAYVGEYSVPCFAYFEIVPANCPNCYGFTDMSSSNTLSWSWDFGDGTYSNEQNPVHTFPDSLDYMVCLSVFTADSCYDSYCVNLGYTNPVILVPTDTSIAMIDTCVISVAIDTAYVYNTSASPNGVIIQWAIVDDGNIIYLSAIYPINQAGVYYVVLTINCNSGAKVTYQVSDVIAIGAEDIILNNNTFGFENNVALFPNPANENINLQFKKPATDCVVRVYNSTGQEVLFEKYNEIVSNQTINLNVLHLQSGLYFVKIQFSNQNSVMLKFVK